MKRHVKDVDVVLRDFNEAPCGRSLLESFSSRDSLIAFMVQAGFIDELTSLDAVLLILEQRASLRDRVASDLDSFKDFSGITDLCVNYPSIRQIFGMFYSYLGIWTVENLIRKDSMWTVCIAVVLIHHAARRGLSEDVFNYRKEYSASEHEEFKREYSEFRDIKDPGRLSYLMCFRDLMESANELFGKKRNKALLIHITTRMTNGRGRNAAFFCNISGGAHKRVDFHGDSQTSLEKCLALIYSGVSGVVPSARTPKAASGSSDVSSDGDDSDVLSDSFEELDDAACDIDGIGRGPKEISLLSDNIIRRSASTPSPYPICRKRSTSAPLQSTCSDGLENIGETSSPTKRALQQHYRNHFL